MNKQFISMVLTICMVLALTPWVALADVVTETPTANGYCFYANGTELLLEAGSTPNNTKVSYTTAGGVRTVLAGYEDKSMNSYLIFGGADGADFSGEVCITIDGGNVKDVYGGCGNNSTFHDLEGNVSIELKSGSVGRILACGYGKVSGAAVSVTISGGTVVGGKDNAINLIDRNNATTTNLRISGGTINIGAIIAVKSGGDFIIDGGNILGTINSDSGLNSATKNSGGANVYRTTLTLTDGGISTTMNAAAVTALTITRGGHRL